MKGKNSVSFEEVKNNSEEIVFGFLDVNDLQSLLEATPQTKRELVAHFAIRMKERSGPLLLALKKVNINDGTAKN